MRTLAAVVAILLITSAPIAGTTVAAVTARSSPTPAQIRAAVRRAEESHTLWATVNICDTVRHRDVIGIRGQMPALGFSAHLAMDVTLSYWNAGQGSFEPIAGIGKDISLGTVLYGTVQSGAKFTFTHPVLLRGAVSFTWLRGRKVVGSVTKLTSDGRKGVDDADPRGHSAATCRISAPATS